MSAVPIDISYRSAGIPSQFHRDSFAHSQGMGGISWGGHSVGSWLKEEAMLNNFNMTSSASAIAASPETANPSYLPNLEADFCRDYSCCGHALPTLHDLLRHYEDSHISPSPPVEPPVIRRMQNLEMVSTNEVFLAPNVTGTASSIAGTPSTSGGGAHDNLGTMNGQQNDVDMCIDDPARQLYVMERSDTRPYKCPVIGCEKTYKNQNGLKYHRLHGHQNQTLHLNEDGTYSIIDPLSNTPYPDGMGMEKDKPYRCEICGKRYKNLNGLKYHRAHSTH